MLKTKAETTALVMPRCVEEIQARLPTPDTPMPEHIVQNGMTVGVCRDLIVQLYFHGTHQYGEPCERHLYTAKRIRLQLGDRLLRSFHKQEVPGPVRLDTKPISSVQAAALEAVKQGFRPLPPIYPLLEEAQCGLVREGCKVLEQLMRGAAYPPLKGWVDGFIATVQEDLSRPCFWHDSIVQVCVGCLGFEHQVSRYHEACQAHSESLRGETSWREKQKRAQRDTAAAEERLEHDRQQWGLT